MPANKGKEVKEQVKKIYDKAQKYIEQNNNIEAINCYNELFDILTKNNMEIKGIYHSELSKLYQEEKYFKSAAKELINYLKTINKNTPIYSVTLNNIGNCYFLEGNYTKALKYFNDSLQLAILLNMIDAPYLYVNVSNCYKKMSQYELSEKNLLMGINLDPKNNKNKICIYRIVLYYERV